VSTPPSVAESSPFVVGEIAPIWFGMGRDRRFHSSEAQYGRPAVMLLVGAEALRDASLVAAMVATPVDGADLLLMIDENPAGVAIVEPSVRVIDAGDLLVRCGIGPAEGLVLVVDRNQRIAMAGPLTLPTMMACRAGVRCLPAETPRDIEAPAPAVIVPNLLSAALCQHLIALFDASETIESGVARVDQDGVCRNVVDPARKRRRDLVLDDGSTIHQMLHETLLRRCRPQIAKAFQAHVSHLDRILIGRYDDSGGWFNRHRDNDARQVAFREFALSVNLNAGAYEGGHLVFPEYNDHRYAPPAGGGLIFSASVLHAVAPVTAGTRYVLLTFLHSDAAEQRRRDYEAAEGRRQLALAST
jgi:predicted 2-oxoglutarate/Fe(II)-dependent dioxygenase YbiX